MDSACYDSADNLIIAVRGGRVFQCNASTGAIQNSVDYQQLAFGPATVVWDAGMNRCFAASMMTPHYDVTAFGADRNLYKINPQTLVVEQIYNFKTTFGLTLGDAALESGIMTMRSDGAGSVYALAFSSTVNPSLHVLKFNAVNPAANSNANITFFNYPSFSLTTITGETFMVWAQQDDNDVAAYGWGGTGFNASATDSTKGYYATEYAPTQNVVYVTREFQFIDIYSNAHVPVYQSTVNTLRSGFNGVNIKRSPINDHLYIAGGADNTVIVLNPADNTFVVKTGFDLPWDFVFTASKAWCVQQGGTPLKEVV